MEEQSPLAASTCNTNLYFDLNSLPQVMRVSLIANAFTQSIKHCAHPYTTH